MLSNFFLSFLVSNAILTLRYLLKLNFISKLVNILRSCVYSYLKLDMGSIADIFLQLDLFKVSNNQIFNIYLSNQSGIEIMDHVSNYVTLLSDFAMTKMNKLTLTIFKLFKAYLT